MPGMKCIKCGNEIIGAAVELNPWYRREHREFFDGQTRELKTSMAWLCPDCAPTYGVTGEDADHLDVVEKACQTCARPLFVLKDWYFNRTVTCSKACIREAARRKASAREIERRAGEAECYWCGEKYTASRRDSLTCSTKCRVARHRESVIQKKIKAEFDRLCARNPEVTGMGRLTLFNAAAMKFGRGVKFGGS
jgi:hypothetical protein